MSQQQSYSMEPESAQFGQQEQFGQQGGRQGGQQGGQKESITMSNTMPDYQWSALTGVAQAIAICEYCKSQCVIEADEHMTECIRLCEDVAELGKISLSLVPQQSRFERAVVSALEQAVQACAQECGQHQHAHCQQCAQVLTQTLDSISQLKQGGQGTGGQQDQFGQQGGQQGQSGQEQFGQEAQQGQSGQEQIGQEAQQPQQFGGQQPGQFQ